MNGVVVSSEHAHVLSSLNSPDGSQETSNSHSIASLPSKATMATSSVQVCRSTVLQRQKALAARHGSGEHMADIHNFLTMGISNLCNNINGICYLNFIDNYVLSIISSLTPTCIGKIAVEVAQFTEAKRKPPGKHIPPQRVRLSPLQGGASLRSTRSSSLRRQHNERQAQTKSMTVKKNHTSPHPKPLCFY